MKIYGKREGGGGRDTHTMVFLDTRALALEEACACVLELMDGTGEFHRWCTRQEKERKTCARPAGVVQARTT